MLEYLIRADDGEPDLGVSMKQLAASFTPPGFAPVVLEAVIRGDPIALGDAELSVADEPGFGWQLTFDGPISEQAATDIAEELARHLGLLTGRPVVVLPL